MEKLFGAQGQVTPKLIVRSDHVRTVPRNYACPGNQQNLCTKFYASLTNIRSKMKVL